MLPVTNKDIDELERMMKQGQDGPLRTIVLSLIAEIRRLQKRLEQYEK